MERFVEVQGVRVPRFMYGTAWKEHRTEGLTRLALEVGFRGIDTANQRKHYFEAGVGAAIATAGIARDELFLQTKFTYVRGQDHRLPYDPDAPVGRQVEQSFASSLEHLGVDHIDSYVLHGPESRRGWSAADREVWSTMERLHRGRRARLLGVSNISRDQLVTLCESATVAPAFVQNRCYARTGWDQEIREVCRKRRIVYQGFSLLTANQRELRDATASTIARRLGATIPQVVFRFAFAVGMVALTGTSDRTHMQQDLAAVDLAVTESDVA
ncbi:MAG: aldo/keto reductase family protein, partial [Thermoleophilaceae bacterium]